MHAILSWYLGNGLGRPRHARLCQRMVRLAAISSSHPCFSTSDTTNSHVPIGSTRGAHVDDVSHLFVLDRSHDEGLPGQVKRCRSIRSKDAVPLFVRCLVGHTIPFEDGTVDDDVDYPIATSRSPLD